MKRPRITIAHVVLAVAVISLGLAAIRSGSPSWTGAMLSITFFLMICSLLGIALERGTWRIYWIGFATLGWGYLLLAYASWLEHRVGFHLLGPNLLAYIAEFLDPDPQAGGSGFESGPNAVRQTFGMGGGFGGSLPTRDIAAYKWIGISLEALLWAFTGGWVACYFASRRQRDTDPTGTPPATVSTVESRSDTPQAT